MTVNSKCLQICYKKYYFQNVL